LKKKERKKKKNQTKQITQTSLAHLLNRAAQQPAHLPRQPTISLSHSHAADRWGPPVRATFNLPAPPHLPAAPATATAPRPLRLPAPLPLPPVRGPLPRRRLKRPAPFLSRKRPPPPSPAINGGRRRARRPPPRPRLLRSPHHL
jgi:hypothetical protein